MFELKMEFMDCADLSGCTMEQSYIFPDNIWYNQWYETLWKCLYHTAAVLEPFLMLIATNLALSGCLGWKWSLWPVPDCLTIQRSKAVFYLNLYDSNNDIKFFRNFCIISQPCHSHFTVDCCQFGPSWMYGLEMELMACADLVGGTTEQICIFYWS